MARIVLAFLSKPRNMLSRSMRNWDSTASASHFSTRISFTTQWKNLRPIGEVKFEHEAICAGRCRPGWAIRSHPQVFRLLGVITVEHVIQLHIERLPEGGYLATSDAVQGLVAQGRTIQETIEIARDVAKKLIEAPNWMPVTEELGHTRNS